jgi:Fibronectin type III domain
VSLSARVANANECAFSVAPTIKGLPVTKPCTKGTVGEKVTVPENKGRKVTTFTFHLTVTGTTTAVAKAIRLSESDILPGAPTRVWATPGDTSASVSFTRPSSPGRSAITRYTVTATDVTTPKNGGQKQSSTGTTIAVNGLTNGDSYAFEVAATNATGAGPSSTRSNKAIPSPPLGGVLSTTSDGGGYCALLSTGGVDCWGYNPYGELGNGTIGGPDEGGYDTPQAVTGIADATSVTAEGQSDYEGGYCALLSTGGVDCWGYNHYGELGNGTTGGPDGAHGYHTPQAVSSQ